MTVVRFLIVGALTNLCLYLLYLLLTFLGVGYALAVTFVYAAGITLSFILNRAWTFGHRGVVAGPLARYLAAYVACYLFNLAALEWLAGRLGYPHQWVQAILVVLCAAVLYLVQKHWVFAGAGQFEPRRGAR